MTPTKFDLVLDADAQLLAQLAARLTGETVTQFCGRAVREQAARVLQPTIDTTRAELPAAAPADAPLESPEPPAPETVVTEPVPEPPVTPSVANGTGVPAGARPATAKRTATVARRSKPQGKHALKTMGAVRKPGKPQPIPDGALTAATPTRVVYDAILGVIEDGGEYTCGQLAEMIRYWPPGGKLGYRGAALRHRLDNPAQVEPIPGSSPKRYTAETLLEYLTPVTDEDEEAAGTP